MSSTPLNIHQRLIKVQKAVTSVLKNEKIELNQSRSYKAVSHDDVAALLHSPLAEAGIVLLPDVIFHEFSTFEKIKYWNSQEQKSVYFRCDLEISVKWINADDPTDFIESHAAAFALDTEDKCFAKAYSLALKICLLKVHLLESRDQEEQRIFEDQDQGPPPQQTQKKAPPKPKNQSPPNAPATPPVVKKTHPGPMGALLDTVKTAGISNHLMPNVIQMAIGEKKKALELAPLEIEQVITFINENYIHKKPSSGES